MYLFKSAIVAMVLLLVAGAPASAAALVAHIDISSQTMVIKKHGFVTNVWRVSTGRKGFETITGSFRPQRTARMWYSRKYDNAPMPYAVFFRGGFAVHGTNMVKQLGRPASHGCVRLQTGNAAKFYAMVQQYGRKNVRIIVTQ
jgi:lipoprotein-anchoring transpeptidase ErfK/SrfK